MPSRKRPQDALGVNRILGFAAAAILFIPCLVEAQQQQRSSVLQRQESQKEARRLEATKIAQALETPIKLRPRKDTLSVTHEQLLNFKKENDVSAIATSRLSSNGISQHTARNLEDWEVEDFVLLATVDGRLHARDRKTGKERWNLIQENPMVQTQYHARTGSGMGGEYTGSNFDDYVWIVEPSRDGSLYYYNPSGPDPGLVNTGLTMKKLNEMSPYFSQDPDVSYTGTKTTSMVTIDAITGDVVKSFGLGGKRTNSGRCVKSNTFLDNAECSPNATLTIGRSEYIVIIQDGKTQDPIATLTFSEWTPNNFDRDLQSQYHHTLDQKYIYASHDGNVIGLDHAQNTAEEPGRLFRHKLSSPVVRVFDIARPWGTDKSDPELVVLPQPLPPIDNDDGWANHPLSSVFLNHTEDGSWYAMSGMTYPYAVQGVRPALCNQPGWAWTRPVWDVTNELDLREALVGLHSIDFRRQEQQRLRTISAPIVDDNQSQVSSPENSLSQDEPLPPILRHYQTWRNRFVEFFGTSGFFSFVLFLLYAYRNEASVQFYRLWAGSKAETRLRTLGILPAKKEIEHRPRPVQEPQVTPETTPSPDVIKSESADPLASVTTTIAGDAVPLQPENAKDIKDEVPKESVLSEVVTGEKPKKAHRGRRGGVKHKKGPKPSENSQDGNPPRLPPTVDDAVRNAQKMGQDQETRLEPDIKTVPTDPTEVSDPIIRLGALVVDTDKLIGNGSNGTLVFRGTFDGRDVAVKRMLIQYFDIASQETKLLRESDDHENVIRYYAQQQAANFLYIALELCPASLAEVIEKPQLHRELAQRGEQDLPYVLYQITSGIQHLHSLRIVHRDLKPQNILVNTHKDGRPRLLVSDFGLCKKLDGEQSSFRATTAHAAGTSGWRAPELLLDDDAHHSGLAMADASTEGNSGPLVNPELLPNRRATRAIDIFSLGLVFFYVLTKGSHPFDCGDRYMREVNIRKGVFNLGLLEVLGDYSFEAKDLIGSMLQASPKLRPAAGDVLAHPFFWKAKTRLNFLCDVSDHFEKEKRDPPSLALQELERYAQEVCGADFLKPLGREFVESMGKQRKYTGTRLLDLLRALRNKKNHYEDMSDHLKDQVGPLPDGYLSFWTRKFPNLLITCWNVVYELRWDDTDRFKEYYQPAGL